MKKLLDWYKALPPQMQMLIAIAGLGTPASALYFIKQKLLPGVSMPMFLLGLVVALGAVTLIGWLISKLFSRGARKRSSKLASELAEAGGAGPQSMDVRAAIKANNEKFNAAVTDMKKVLGVSVYDLPWYIIIGDSGCGKTKLINESGLTFSTGKPEGYQLGTLNYNWWFTEDAIFIDMAGRLCNPTDDSDRREWEGVLGTIARGRRGFPINGVVVCVSAEHLLQDSAEKHEADANTALERLRDLQNKLAVTFATYLAVTKCDKVLGFMQFFDRADRDITIKNQIFGWSRPGEFNQLYDPELFGGDFDLLYRRLNELRLRRLNDEADETELGMAYAFPEEFRELRAPLQTYVRTLFPMIKNPRGVKNLIFRGVYFTSATQQGGVILKHLSERLGAAAADNFPPLESLYPRPRPLFAKDLWIRKVFPEKGLVFRNEEQVLRNKRLSKLLKVGSVVMGLLLFSTMFLGMYKFEEVVTKPRENAVKAPEILKSDAGKALEHAVTLDHDASSLLGGLTWARFVVLIGSTAGPVNQIREIRNGLFEKRVLPQILADVGSALKTGTRLTRLTGRDAFRKADAEGGDGPVFCDALAEYVGWYAAGQKTPSAASQPTVESFKQMYAVVDEGGSLVKMKGFLDVSRKYFESLGDSRGGTRTNPTSILAEATMQAAKRIGEGVGHVYTYFGKYAALDENNPDDTISEWSRIRKACSDLQTHYTALLAMADRPIESLDDMAKLQKDFRAEFALFDAAFQALAWRGAPGKNNILKIPLISEALLKWEHKWKEYAARLKAAAPDEKNLIPIFDSIQSSNVDLGRKGLDELLWAAINSNGLLTTASAVPNYERESFMRLVREVPAVNPDIFTLTQSPDAFTPDTLRPTDQANQVRSVLLAIRDRLDKGDFSEKKDLSGESVEAWTDELETMSNAEPPVSSAPAGLKPFWNQDKLTTLDGSVGQWMRRGQGTRLLRNISARLEQAAQKEWGFADMVRGSERIKPQESPFSIEALLEASDREPSPASPASPTGAPRPRGKPRKFDPLAGAGVGTPAPTVGLPRTGSAGGRVPACATPGFMQDRARELVTLLHYVNGADPSQFLKETGGGSLTARCSLAIETAGRKYAEAYAKKWGIAYAAYHLKKLDDLSTETRWTALAEKLGADRTTGTSRVEISEDFRIALSSILQATRWVQWVSSPLPGAEWRALPAEEWRTISSWVSDAFSRTWNPDAPHRFIAEAHYEARQNDVPGHPWESIAAAFSERWKDIARAIGQNRTVGARFTEEDANTPRKPIPWADVKTLQELYGLTDERLTNQLLDFDRHAQELLSWELTGALCRVQSEYLQYVPFDGWPYRKEPDNETATVPFDQFKKFLKQMAGARKILEPLESGLPKETPGWQERHLFYEQCDRWHAFLLLDSQSKATNLEVDTKYVDPKDRTMPTAIQASCADTAGLHYGFATLNLGLEARRESGASGKPFDPQRIPTVHESAEEFKARGAIWKWPTESAGKILFQFKEPIAKDVGNQDSPTRELGKSSPLGLCAYLHRYAQKNVPGASDEVWFTLHTIEVDAGPQGKMNLGAMIQFTLGRKMPDPIVPLKAPEASRERPAPTGTR